MKKIVANPDACMGCGLCEVYCIVQHSKSKDIIKAYNREKPRPISRVRREMSKPVSFAIQCRHCDDAPCVEACLAGAMTKDKETGLVTHNPDKCIGCWTCVMICPYGAIKMDVEGKVVAKCDRCVELEVPACVANCPNQALEFKEVEP
ncbi:MAG: 4Fe-4S dicluster domain-containing protein [Candidatus Bathyarchaeota archaeon]|nr:4Fe-4S dicluster domain-containing protein [Candidatus Bathyarchaeota archaeon]